MKNLKLIGGVCIVVAVVAVVGFLLLNHNDDSTLDGSDASASQQNNAKCTIVEAMQKIQPTNTQEEITEITGLEPTVDAMIGSDPIWKFDAKNWISYKTNNNNVTIQATIDKEDLKDENIKLPLATELEKMLNNNSFTYNELVKLISGEGTLTSISSNSVIYTWVDKNNQKLNATFDNKTGKCSIASYR